MDSANAAQSEPTVRDQMPWVDMTFDFTDSVCGLIPEELLDWRPVDPSGKFQFSLAEIVMHCADERLSFARQLSGSDAKEDYWDLSIAKEGDWEFKPWGSKADLLRSLQIGRKALDEYLDLPVAWLLEPTDGTRAEYGKNVAMLSEKAPERVAGLRRRGPANVMRVLMAAAVHEAGHRGTLYTLLRQHGLNLPDND